MTQQEAFAIELDRAWWPLGDGNFEPEAIADALVETMAPPLDENTKTGLHAHLSAYARWAQSLAPGSRRSFVLVRDPAAGRADALASWRYSTVEGDVYDRYLDIARAQKPTEDFDLVNQRILEYRLPAGRAIAVHDFVVDLRGGLAQPTKERCTLALFPDGEPLLIELHLATIDLALFDDMVAYAVALMSGELVPPPGRLEYTGGNA